jgi:hypothetical protein
VGSTIARSQDPQGPKILFYIFFENINYKIFSLSDSLPGTEVPDKSDQTLFSAHRNLNKVNAQLWQQTTLVGAKEGSERSA